MFPAARALLHARGSGAVTLYHELQYVDVPGRTGSGIEPTCANALESVRLP